MWSWPWSISLAKHFVIDFSRHASSRSRHSGWILSNWWADIILIAALLPHRMRRCSNRLSCLLLATRCDIGFFSRSIRTCRSGSRTLSCILGAFRGWTTVSRGSRVTASDSYLLPLLSLHCCCRCLKLIWFGIRLFDSRAVQHWRLKLLLLLLLCLLLFLMALSIPGQTWILPWVHHFREYSL